VNVQQTRVCRRICLWTALCEWSATLRVSTSEQASSGAGLAVQREAVHKAVGDRGWHMVGIHEDAGHSARDLRRPGVQAALAIVDAGGADAVVLAKLDRLSRSLLDFASLIERSRQRGWSLIALDIGLDTTTANGRMMAGLIAVIAEWERELIGQRTKEALAVRRSQGVRLGRPERVPTELKRQMQGMRQMGMSYRAIASSLTAAGQPTAQGGRRWCGSTVKAVLDRSDAPRADTRSR
jgi:DNA invertase Pin-like site-specific DNA recombinase